MSRSTKCPGGLSTGSELPLFTSHSHMNLAVLCPVFVFMRGSCSSLVVCGCDAPSSWKPNSSRILPLSDSIHNDLSRMRFSEQLQFTSIQVWCSFPFYLQQVGTTSSLFNFICNILELKSLVSSAIWSRFSLLLVALRS